MSKNINIDKAGSDIARPKAEERSVYSTRLTKTAIDTLKDIKRYNGTAAQHVIEEGIALYLAAHPVVKD